MAYPASMTMEEHTQAYQLNAKSIFSDAAADLAFLHKEHRRFLEAQQLQPYADLLFARIMDAAAGTESKKRLLLSTLKEQIRGTDKMENCAVTLWEFNAIHWHQTLEQKMQCQPAFRPAAERETARLISENGWDARIGTKMWWDRDNIDWSDEYPEENFSWELTPVRVHRVFKNTDLLQRINAQFGTKFMVRLSPSILERPREGSDGFTVYRYQVRLFYLGKDLYLPKLRDVLAVAKKYSTHKDYALQPSETVHIE